MTKKILCTVLLISLCLVIQAEELNSVSEIRGFILKASSYVYDDATKWQMASASQERRYNEAKKKPIAKDKCSKPGCGYYVQENHLAFRSPKAMIDLLGGFYTNNAAKCEIDKDQPQIVFWGRVANSGGTGEFEYGIDKDLSQFVLRENGPKKKVVDITAFDDGNNQATLSYTLEKPANRWLITDIKGYRACNPTFNKHFDDYYEKIYITWNVTASTALTNHKVELIQDKMLPTAWAEGVSGNGVGEWIKFSSPEDECFIEMEIMNGYAKSKALYQANNRIKKVRVEFDEGQVFEHELKDNNLGYQKIEFGDMIVSRWAKVTILEVYPGSKYDDTCISEIRFF